MPELGRPDSPAAAPALAGAPALSSGAPEIGGIAVGKVGPPMALLETMWANYPVLTVVLGVVAANLLIMVILLALALIDDSWWRRKY